MSEWFVLNARDADWEECRLGKFCQFEPRDARFPEVGFNLNVLAPGEPMTMYHREQLQEDFMVLEGECLLVVEGEERTMQKWDLFHCPAGIAHAIVGAGEGLSVVLAVGSRVGDGQVVYPVDPAALRHGAGVAVETSSPKEAYAGLVIEQVRYQEGWLPE